MKEAQKMNKQFTWPTFLRSFAVYAVFAFIVLGLVIFYLKFTGEQKRLEILGNRPVIIEPVLMPTKPQTEFTPQELAKLFNDNQKTKEAIEHRVVEVTGHVTSIESTRQAFKADGVMIFLDASPDGVSAENIMCLFKPAEGKSFSVNFLQWLQSVPNGTSIRIKGTIRVLPDDKFTVKFVLVRCALLD